MTVPTFLDGRSRKREEQFRKKVQEFGVNFTKYDNCLWEKYI